jgi:hypothetical protein
MCAENQEKGEKQRRERQKADTSIKSQIYVKWTTSETLSYIYIVS